MSVGGKMSDVFPTFWLNDVAGPRTRSPGHDRAFFVEVSEGILAALWLLTRSLMRKQMSMLPAACVDIKTERKDFAHGFSG